MRVQWSRRRYHGLRLGAHWAHGKGGYSVVLKSESSWRTISGVAVNTPWGILWAYWRNGR